MSLGISSSIARRTLSSGSVPPSSSGRWLIPFCRAERGNGDGARVRRRSPRWWEARSEALERALARVRDLEECVELRELEQGLEVVVEVREPQFAALLANLLRERHEDAKPGAVDVTRLAEIDQEALLALFELIEDLLL